MIMLMIIVVLLFINMCTSPITIKNRSIDFNARKKLQVPCGKCLSCQKTKQDGIEYRAIKEYDYTIAKGGQVYFITFTYDDSHLPYVYAVPAATQIGGRFLGVDESKLSANMPMFKPVSCFSKQDLQKFNKRLRSRLKYYGYDVTISYLIVSEFGSDDEYVDNRGFIRKGTQRPHYHAIYYLIPNNPNDSRSVPSRTTFLNMTYDCWKKCEKYCFKEYLIDNKPLSAISYTSKYIYKQQSDDIFRSRIPSYPVTFVRPVSKLYMNDIRDYDKPLYQYYTTYEFVDQNECMPFTLCSRNFGCKHLLSKSIPELVSLLSKNTSIINQNGSIYSMPFPSYYIKKFLYKNEQYIIDHREPILPFEETDTIYEIRRRSVRIDEFVDIYLEKQREIIQNNYAQVCAKFYSFDEHPFSETFLKYGLLDYMASKDCHINIMNGDESTEDTLDNIIFNSYFHMCSDEDKKWIRTNIDTFIQSVADSRNELTRSKLFIQREKVLKRSAERNMLIHQRHAYQYTSKKLQNHVKALQSNKKNSNIN